VASSAEQVTCTNAHLKLDYLLLGFWVRHRELSTFTIIKEFFPNNYSASTHDASKRVQITSEATAVH
jgi:hypothetical protein